MLSNRTTEAGTTFERLAARARPREARTFEAYCAGRPIPEDVVERILLRCDWWLRQIARSPDPGSRRRSN